MKKTLILLVILIAIAGAAYYFFHKEESAQTAIPRGAASFAWTYEGWEEDTILKTRISLTASYEDGTSEKKVVDTVEGNCNLYQEEDADVYEGSSMIICYFAGLGRYFKVVADDEGYAVQRRIFDEPTAEFTPPVQPYETVARF